MWTVGGGSEAEGRLRCTFQNPLCPDHDRTRSRRPHRRGLLISIRCKLAHELLKFLPVRAGRSSWTPCWLPQPTTKSSSITKRFASWITRLLQRIELRCVPIAGPARFTFKAWRTSAAGMLRAPSFWVPKRAAADIAANNGVVPDPCVALLGEPRRLTNSRGERRAQETVARPPYQIAAQRLNRGRKIHATYA